MDREQFIDRLKKSKIYNKDLDYFYFLVKDRLDKVFYELNVPCKVIMSSSNSYRINMNVRSIFVKDMNMRRFYRVNKNSFYKLSDTEYDKTVFLYVDNISEIEVIDSEISKEMDQYLNIFKPSNIDEVVNMVDHLNNIKRLLGMRENSYSEIWEIFKKL